MKLAAKTRAVAIRQATADDASAIAALLLEAFFEFEALYTPEAFDATTLDAARISRRMHEGPVWVAVHENEIVGTAAATNRGNALYIRGMGVLPRQRGLGVATALLRTAEQFAIESGCRRLLLSTTPFLLSAIRLYEQYGFRRSSEGPTDLFGTPLFSMTKELKP